MIQGLLAESPAPYSVSHGCSVTNNKYAHDEQLSSNQLMQCQMKF